MYLSSKWRMYECAPDSSLLSRVLEKPKTEHKLWPGLSDRSRQFFDELECPRTVHGSDSSSAGEG